MDTIDATAPIIKHIVGRTIDSNEFVLSAAMDFI